MSRPGLSWMLLSLVSAGLTGSGAALLLSGQPGAASRLVGAVGYALLAWACFQQTEGHAGARPPAELALIALGLVGSAPDLWAFALLAPGTALVAGLTALATGLALGGQRQKS